MAQNVLFMILPAGVIKWVRMLYIYIPTQIPEEDWRDHMQNHQADSPLYVWPDVCDLLICTCYKKYGHTWHRMSLLRPGVSKRHRTPEICSWSRGRGFKPHRYEFKVHSVSVLLMWASIELTLTVLVATIDAQWEGMGDVGSARYEPALLPPCPTIRVLSYSD